MPEFTSTPVQKPVKPEKPSPDFPLFPHATGRWAKKIRGKLHYFGPWANPDDAVQKYHQQRDDLHAGREPRLKTDGLTVRELCQRYLNAKQNRLDAGEISPRTFQEQDAICAEVVGSFGRERRVDDLRPSDFEKLRVALSRRLGPVALANAVSRVRSVFKFAFDDSLIAQPLRFGNFRKPAKKVLRAHRQQSQLAHGKRMFEAGTLRLILAALDGNEVTLPQPTGETAEPIKITLPRQATLRAMVLLGINAAFGQSDLSALPRAALNLDGGWVDFPRPKTAVERRAKLWPETVAAIRESLAERPTARNPDDEGLVFLTRLGSRWVRLNANQTPDDVLGKRFSKLLTVLKLRQKGRNFYALRHTTATIGGQAKDEIALQYLMGHVDPSMTAAYREAVSDQRLEAISTLVHDWLFPAVVPVPVCQPSAEPEGIA